jgi:hypothetical protein
MRKPWYFTHRDGKIHGLIWLTDDEALARLTRDPDWARKPPVIKPHTIKPATKKPVSYWGAPFMPEFADPKDN